MYLLSLLVNKHWDPVNPTELRCSSEHSEPYSGLMTRAASQDRAVRDASQDGLSTKCSGFADHIVCSLSERVRTAAEPMQLERNRGLSTYQDSCFDKLLQPEFKQEEENKHVFMPILGTKSIRSPT